MKTGSPPMRQVAVIRALFAALIVCAGSVAAAAESANTSAETRANFGTGGYATVDLAELLDDVGRKSNKQFLLDARAPARVVVGTVDVKRVTYPQLLAILKNNGCAAVPGPSVVNIVPSANVRTYALPVVNKDDGSRSEERRVGKEGRGQEGRRLK